jgi:hypothetical protein
MRPLSPAALACCLLLFASGTARAGTIIVGGGWQAFTWDNAPGTFNSEGPLTYTSANPTRLTVTDAFLDGDRFQVFDNGTLLGLTSAPTADGNSVDGNPDAAVTNPKFSSGKFLLAAGSHAVTLKITAIAPGYPSGSGYLRVDLVGPVATPEPACLTLLAAAGAYWTGDRWWRSRRGSRPRSCRVASPVPQ